MSKTYRNGQIVKPIINYDRLTQEYLDLMGEYDEMGIDPEDDDYRDLLERIVRSASQLLGWDPGELDDDEPVERFTTKSNNADIERADYVDGLALYPAGLIEAAELERRRMRLVEVLS